MIADPLVFEAVLQMDATIFGQSLDLWIALLIAAFAGGVLGASLGALPSFVFMGFVIIGGEAVRLAGINLGEGPLVGGWTGNIAFGAFLGPHITFAAGAAASAYAAQKGYMEPDFGGNWGYHDGKNILIAFAGRYNDVLLIGGLFGVLGYLITYVSAFFALPWDPIAMGVVLSALAHRVAFGYDVMGTVRGDGRLDVSPFEREDVYETDGSGGQPLERLDAEPWLPWYYSWSGVGLVGFAFGALGGLSFYYTGSMFLAFGISAASLIFLNTGITGDYEVFQVAVPVTHHVTLPAATAPAAYAGFGADMAPAVADVQSELLLTEAVVLGIVFGVLGALLGELSQRIFYMHADTHWDPPATSIVMTSFLIAVLAIIGVFESGGYVPIPV